MKWFRSLNLANIVVILLCIGLAVLVVTRTVGPHFFNVNKSEMAIHPAQPEIEHVQIATKPDHQISATLVNTIPTAEDGTIVVFKIIDGQAKPMRVCSKQKGVYAIPEYILAMHTHTIIYPDENCQKLHPDIVRPLRRPY